MRSFERPLSKVTLRMSDTIQHSFSILYFPTTQHHVFLQFNNHSATSSSRITQTTRQYDEAFHTFQHRNHYDIVDVVLPTNKNSTRKNLRDAHAPVRFADRVEGTVRKMIKATDHVIVYYRDHGSFVDKPNDILLE